MKKSKTRKYILIISVAVLLLAAFAVGLSQAKYKTEKTMTGKVKFTASLAENLLIQEHRAARNGDGSYTLVYDDIKDNEGNVTVPAVVQAQDYKLMPGVDVPKDPFVTVTGKTSLPGWLFVEVVPGEDFPAEVTYAVRSADDATDDEPGYWIDTGLTGENTGKIYVYYKQLVTADTQTTVSGGEGEEDTIVLTEFYILATNDKNNTLTVSQTLKRDTNAKLDFYAYLCQVITQPATAEGAEAPTDAAIAAAAAADFTTCFGSNNG
jgi:hypothetical protein